jgi:hypothetical protein
LLSQGPRARRRRTSTEVHQVHHFAPDPTSTADTGTLRGDALAWLRDAADLLAGPAGEALRGLLGDGACLGGANRKETQKTRH